MLQSELKKILFFILPQIKKQRESQRHQWQVQHLHIGLCVAAHEEEDLGDAVVHSTGVNSELGLTILFSTTSLILSELTSNTATAAMMCPLAVMTAQQLGLPPVAPVVASGLGVWKALNIEPNTVLS